MYKIHIRYKICVLFLSNFNFNFIFIDLLPKVHTDRFKTGASHEHLDLQFKNLKQIFKKVF